MWPSWNSHPVEQIVTNFGSNPQSSFYRDVYFISSHPPRSLTRETAEDLLNSCSLIQIGQTVSRKDIITWLAIENTKAITLISMQVFFWQNKCKNQRWLSRWLFLFFWVHGWRGKRLFLKSFLVRKKIFLKQ